MQTNPEKLYRYSTLHWLKRSLELGEFRLCPASKYSEDEQDKARHDNELERTKVSQADQVTIYNLTQGKPIQAGGPVTFKTSVGTNYYTVCFSKKWDTGLFDDFEGSDACLVIKNVSDFCERLLHAGEQALHNWAGLAESVTYGRKSDWGAVYSKDSLFSYQEEWRFAWCPPKRIDDLNPIIVTIGNIEDIAEIVKKQ